jgi:protoheme IX farnesyltransferase
MSDVLLAPRPVTWSSVSRDYLELSKSRIVMMVLITTAAGFLFAPARVDVVLLLHTLLGTALVAAGTNALNQYVEREHDAKMRRTRMRPLPDGRITPRAALVFSAGIAILGTAYLGLAVNWLTAALGALTLTSYIFVYTPLKRVSTICTIVGAVPGAIPPLMGWTAATNSLAIGGWIIFGVLFLWQLPHFMAISWIYREDYGSAGFAMLATRDEAGLATARQAIIYSILLLPVVVAPAFLGMAGPLYLIGVLAASAAFVAASFAFYFERSTRTARRLFMVSNLHLLTVMTLLVGAARA